MDQLEKEPRQKWKDTVCDMTTDVVYLAFKEISISLFSSPLVK